MGAAVEKVPGWLERLLLPKLSEIKGELAGVRGEITAVRGELAALRSDVARVEGTTKSDIARVDLKIDSLRSELKADIRTVDQRVVEMGLRVDVVRELDDLRAQVA
ncbi:MAG: hypothetical protein KGJ23_00535 [Euryarchaeota archaeon]|nr:hypothetical protein [Euryarchaeota archaeon]MDE1835083.1 hypothetical protein [Euryarchaeota archaeon]MDE2044954.1 hypothetical protein [Thermoplasmata archaeon]